jgi:hypothetical protein
VADNIIHYCPTDSVVLDRVTSKFFTVHHIAVFILGQSKRSFFLKTTN